MLSAARDALSLYLLVLRGCEDSEGKPHPKDPTCSQISLPRPCSAIDPKRLLFP
jgi:hypothetical protein